MKRTIQELREARGESRADLATSLQATEHDVTTWETGTAEPTVERLLVLAKHFGVRDDQINLRPGDPPSLGEAIADLF